MVDFEEIKIAPYSLLFIDKDRVHQFDANLKYEGVILVFTDSFFCLSERDNSFLRSSILFNDLEDRPTLKITKQNFQKFNSICESIIEELSLPPDDSKHFIVKNLVHNFLLIAEREKRKQGFKEFKKSTDLDLTLLFRDLLEKNYTSLKSVSDYARILYVSEKRLGQATAKILGNPPKEIINERVLLEAKRVLAHTNLSVKEIGQNLGFDDPAYFIRYFKKNTNSTPVEFRETH